MMFSNRPFIHLHGILMLRCCLTDCTDSEQYPLPQIIRIVQDC